MSRLTCVRVNIENLLIISAEQYAGRIYPATSGSETPDEQLIS